MKLQQTMKTKRKPWLLLVFINISTVLQSVIVEADKNYNTQFFTQNSASLSKINSSLGQYSEEPFWEINLSNDKSSDAFNQHESTVNHSSAKGKIILNLTSFF